MIAAISGGIPKDWMLSVARWDIIRSKQDVMSLLKRTRGRLVMIAISVCVTSIRTGSMARLLGLPPKQPALRSDRSSMCCCSFRKYMPRGGCSRIHIGE